MSFSIRDHLDPSGDGPSDPLRLPPEVEADAIIPDELVDQMLDGEIDADKASEVMSIIRRDKPAARRFDKTAAIIGELRNADRELECPDFSAKILSEVASRSGLFSPVGFRRMLGYRYAAAAALVLAMGGLFVAQRIAPDAVRLAPQSAPVAKLVDSVPAETAGMFSGVRSALSSITGGVPKFAPSPLAVRRLTESGDLAGESRGSKFNLPINAVLWSNECARASSPVCRGRCSGTSAADSWAAVRNPHNAILLEGARGGNPESDVVFVSLRR